MTSAIWAQQPALIVSSEPVQVRGDEAVLTLDITVPEDAVFEHEGVYIVTPKLGSHKFTSTEISVIPGGEITSGTTVKRVFTAPLHRSMFGKELTIKHKYVFGKDTKKFDDITSVEECCLTTGNLYVMNAQFDDLLTVSKATVQSTQTNDDKAEAKEAARSPKRTSDTQDVRENDMMPVMVVGQVNFPVDNAKLTSRQQGEHINTIGEFLQLYPDAKIEIHGYASPEGPYFRNSELAQQRARSTKNWLLDQLEANGYGAFANKANITVTSTSEDWEGFRYTVQNTNLSEKERDRILQLVSGPDAMILDGQEDQIFAASNGNDALEPQLQPLRRSTIVVTTDQIDADIHAATMVDAYSSNNASESEIKKMCMEGEVLDAVQSTHAAEGKVTMMSSFEAKVPHDKVANMDMPKDKSKTYAAEDQAQMKSYEKSKKTTHDNQANQTSDKQIVSDDPDVVITKGTPDQRIEPTVYNRGNYEERQFVFNVQKIEDIRSYDIEAASDLDIEVTYDEEPAIDEIDEDFHVAMIQFIANDEEAGAEEDYTIKLRSDLTVLKEDLEASEGANRGQIANDIGALYLFLGEHENAKGFLDIAKEVNAESPALNYNYQLYYLAAGNFEKALWYAKRSKPIDGSAYNRALAMIMTGDAQGSIEALKQFVVAYPDMAAGHYLLAVAAARTDNASLMSQHLARAVDINPALGKMASRDLEFRPYWDNTIFEQATVASR